MKKFWIQVVVLLIVIFGGLYSAYNPAVLDLITKGSFNLGSNTLQKAHLKVNDTVIEAELANTPNLRSKGLGGREGLASDSGMLFVFSESKKYQFWMKNMKIPLDFIFINDGKVVDILSKVSPPVINTKDSELPIYEPNVPIIMMLEVNSGFVEGHNIKIGDPVSLIQT